MSSTRKDSKAKVYSAAKSFDYDNLLKYLRQLRLEDNKIKEEERRRQEEKKRMEARHQNHLFDKEFVPGKGMKNGGYGGILVGKHYEMKQKLVNEEAEKARNKQWLELYNKKREQER